MTQSQQVSNFPLPKGYTSLRELSPGKNANVFAVVSSFKPIAQSNGPDLVCSVCLVDPTYTNGGIRVMLFRRKREYLPVLEGPGVVIRLNNLKIQMFGDTRQGISTWKTSFTTFSFQGLSLPVTVRVPPMESASLQSQAVTDVSEEDRRTAKDLYEWWLTAFDAAHAGPDGGVSAIATAPKLKPPRPVLTTRQLSPNVFLDYACEILHIYPSSGQPSLQMAVTDYTEHDNLKPSEDFQHSSIHHSTPISGRRVIYCTLWDGHADIGAKTLKSGQIVLLKNVRCKWNGESHLELSMHGEQDGKLKKNQIVILAAGDKEHERIRTQREEFAGAVGSRDSEQSLVKSTSELRRPEDPVPLSTRKDNHFQPEQGPSHLATTSPQRSSRLHSELGSNDVVTTPARKNRRLQSEPAVSIKQMDLPITKISKILSQERVCKYRVRARVVGVLPTRLEDLTKKLCKRCDMSFSCAPGIYQHCPRCGVSLKDSYVFMFSLLLEDGTADGGDDYLQVIVFGPDGEDFLPGIPPSDLYRDSISVQMLQERLLKLVHPSNDDADSNRRASKKFRAAETLDDDETVARNGSQSSDTENPVFDFCILSYYVMVEEDEEIAASNGREREERKNVTVDGVTSKNWRRRFRLTDTVLA